MGKAQSADKGKSDKASTAKGAPKKTASKGCGCCGSGGKKKDK